MVDDDIWKKASPDEYSIELKSQFGEAAWVIAYLRFHAATIPEAKVFAEELLTILGRKVMISTVVPPLLAAEAFHAYVPNAIWEAKKMQVGIARHSHQHTYAFLSAMIVELESIDNRLKT